MSNLDDPARRVRQHVYKVLAQIPTVNDPQRHQPGPVSDNTVEIDREEDGARPINGDKGPT